MGNCDIQGTKIEERGFGYTIQDSFGKKRHRGCGACPNLLWLYAIVI